MILSIDEIYDGVSIKTNDKHLLWIDNSKSINDATLSSKSAWASRAHEP